MCVCAEKTMTTVTTNTVLFVVLCCCIKCYLYNRVEMQLYYDVRFVLFCESSNEEEAVFTLVKKSIGKFDFFFDFMWTLIIVDSNLKEMRIKLNLRKR